MNRHAKDRRNGGMHAPAGGKLARDPAPFGLGGLHKVPQHAVDGILVKNADVPVRQDIAFEGFQFQHVPYGFIFQENGSEIRQAGLGAYRSVLGDFDLDGIARKLVGKGLDGRQFGVQSGFSVLFIILFQAQFTKL